MALLTVQALIVGAFNMICQDEGMADKAGMKRIELGATGRHVSRAVARYREGRGLTYQALSERLAEASWPIPELGLRRIESEARRVTVDDLMAIAAALDVSPVHLLLPDTEDVANAPTGVASAISDPSELTAWARGETTLDPEARREYWLTRADELESELSELATLENSGVSKARSWAVRSRRLAEENLLHARRRVDELTEEIDG